MTGELWAQLVGGIGFFILVSGTLWGIWWRIEGKVKGAEDKADRVLAELSAHRLHSAEVFATKQGMQEQTGQIMRAIEGVGSRIDGLNERLDRMYENPPARRGARSI